VGRQTIEAPPVQPPLLSLLTSADTVEDGERWQDGVQWVPEQVVGGGTLASSCFGDTGSKPPSSTPGLNTADPFGIYAEDHCSTIGFQARDYEGRARRQLAAIQSFYVANELQLGGIAGTAGGGDNVSLTDANLVGPASPPAEALGILEAAAGAALGGARCMIHVTLQGLDALMHAQQIYQAGQKWLTAAGNIVVADAGYGLENGAVFMYATTMVKVRLSPVLIIPGSFPDAMRQATAIATNFVTIYAERLALVQFDSSFDTPGNLMFKIELDLPPWHYGS
jgi:hypothetical protein